MEPLEKPDIYYIEGEPCLTSPLLEVVEPNGKAGVFKANIEEWAGVYILAVFYGTLRGMISPQINEKRRNSSKNGEKEKTTKKRQKRRKNGEIFPCQREILRNIDVLEGKCGMISHGRVE